MRSAVLRRRWSSPGDGFEVSPNSPTGFASMRFVAPVVVLAVCVHAGLWALLREQTTAPDFDGQLASVSYAPYARSGDPEAGYRPTPQQIRADLKAIAPLTRAIRTYDATTGG